jgi:hypothetical protein
MAVARLRITPHQQVARNFLVGAPYDLMTRRTTAHQRRWVAFACETGHSLHQQSNPFVDRTDKTDDGSPGQAQASQRGFVASYASIHHLGMTNDCVMKQFRGDVSSWDTSECEHIWAAADVRGMARSIG